MTPYVAIPLWYSLVLGEQLVQAKQFEFTVESYNTDPEGRAQQSDTHLVFAASPEAAALKALNEELFPIGNVQRLRARVSRVDADGTVIETTLYKKV